MPSRADTPATNIMPALASNPTDSRKRAGRRVVLRSARSRPRSRPRRRPSRATTPVAAGGFDPTAVVVDGRPNCGAACPNQRHKCHQHRQDEPRCKDRRVGPPGRCHVGRLDAQEPEDAGDERPAGPDPGRQREHRGRAGDRQRRCQVKAPDPAGPPADGLHDPDLRYLLGEQAGPACSRPRCADSSRLA